MTDDATILKWYKEKYPELKVKLLEQVGIVQDLYEILKNKVISDAKTFSDKINNVLENKLNDEAMTDLVAWLRDQKQKGGAGSDDEQSDETDDEEGDDEGENEGGDDEGGDDEGGDDEGEDEATELTESGPTESVLDTDSEIGTEDAMRNDNVSESTTATLASAETVTTSSTTVTDPPKPR